MKAESFIYSVGGVYLLVTAILSSSFFSDIVAVLVCVSYCTSFPNASLTALIGKYVVSLYRKLSACTALPSTTTFIVFGKTFIFCHTSVAYTPAHDIIPITSIPHIKLLIFPFIKIPPL